MGFGARKGATLSEIRENVQNEREERPFSDTVAQKLSNVHSYHMCSRSATLFSKKFQREKGEFFFENRPSGLFSGNYVCMTYHNRYMCTYTLFPLSQVQRATVDLTQIYSKSTTDIRQLVPLIHNFQKKPKETFRKELLI